MTSLGSHSNPVSLIIAPILQVKKLRLKVFTIFQNQTSIKICLFLELFSIAVARKRKTAAYVSIQVITIAVKDNHKI